MKALLSQKYTFFFSLLFYIRIMLVCIRLSKYVMC